MTASFLKYEMIKTHLLKVHGVTEEACFPSSILLPSNTYLFHWSCKLCRDFRMKPTEKLVIQHIGKVHGSFYLASGGWWSAVCRICDVEWTGDEVRKHKNQHRREGFAIEEH